MATINYDFKPNDRVFVVLEDETIRTGEIAQTDITIFKRNGNDVTSTEYIVLLDDEIKSILAKAENVFATFAEASNSISP